MFDAPSRTKSDSLPLSSPHYPSFSGTNSGVITGHEGISPNTRTYPTNPARHDQRQSHPFNDAYLNTHYQTEPHDPSNSVLSQSYNRGRIQPLHNIYAKPSDHPVIASQTRRGEVPLMIDTYNIGMGYTQSSPLPTRAPSSDFPKSADFWFETEQGSSPQPRPRKPRREKPRIDLAPDQPPTTQGKPRERVYVACLQWYIFHSIFIWIQLISSFP
jgi:hypothetical protein